MPEQPSNNLSLLKFYISRQASSSYRYWFEQTVMFILGWIPTVIGIGLQSIYTWQTVLLLNPDTQQAQQALKEAQKRFDQQ